MDQYARIETVQIMHLEFLCRPYLWIYVYVCISVHICVYQTALKYE